jgi:hypothetical protein
LLCLDARKFELAVTAFAEHAISGIELQWL